MAKLSEISNSRVATVGASRTNWVDLSVTGISGDNGFSNVYSRARASRDSDGQYSLEFQVIGTRTSNTTPTGITLTGVTFKNLPSDVQSVNGYSDDSGSYVQDGDSIIFLSGGSAGTSAARVFGNVILDSKPSWFDDNLELESGLPIATASLSGIATLPQEATDTTAGLVKKGVFSNHGTTANVYPHQNANDYTVASGSNLEVGEIYLMIMTVFGRTDSGSGTMNWVFRHPAATLLNSTQYWSLANVDTTETAYHIFTASATNWSLATTTGTAPSGRGRGGTIGFIKLSSLFV